MLSFLNSAVLFGLAAVSIPILIHLFTRQKTKVIYFSSLAFLKELQKQKIRRLKLRQLLLLILRTLLVLALVLAFARPTLRTQSSSLSSSAQLTAVVILDNTLSMGRVSQGRRLLDIARARAQEIVSLMRDGDEIYILHPQSSPKFAHDGPRYKLAAVQESIENTELAYTGTDYVAALAAANAIMTKSSNVNKEVYLIGDLQQNGLKQEAEANGNRLLDEDVKLFVLPLQANGGSENLTISGLAIGNQILEKGKVAEVQVQVQNTCATRVRNKLTHLFMNGKRLGQDVVDILPGAAESKLFRVVPDRAGFQSGYVMLENDDLLEDNRRYFTFNISAEIPVLLVGNQPGDTRYLKLALRPQRGVGSYINVTEIGATEFQQQDINNYQVVILSNVPKLASAEVQKLQNYVKLGGGLMVFLGSDVDLRNYNELLHKRLKLPALTRTLKKNSQEQFLSIGKIDYGHPIFNGVFDEEKSVESPHVRFAVDVSPDSRVDRIIEYGSGAPFLFESQLQKGRILYVTTSVARDWSDLTLRGLFVPLLNRSVVYLSGAAAAEHEQLLVGSEIEFASERIAAGSTLAMEIPDGTRVRAKPEVAAGRYVVRFNQTWTPGIYKLFDAETLIAQWAVNYDASELKPGTFEIDALDSRLAETQAVVIERDANIAEKLKETRFGRELWKTLVFIALLAILLETVLSREKPVAAPAHHQEA